MSHPTITRELAHWKKEADMRPNPIATIALLIAAVGTFALGLTMGQNTERATQDREYAEILVGSGCENAAPDQLVLASEEDGFAMPCKEITLQRVAIRDLEG